MDFSRRPGKEIQILFCASILVFLVPSSISWFLGFLLKVLFFLVLFSVFSVSSVVDYNDLQVNRKRGQAPHFEAR